MTSELPVGTVTFLFTDIEGSTRLLDALGEHYGESLEAHRRLLRDAFAANNGREVDMQGDAFFVAFASAHEAVRAAARAQRDLAEHRWPLDMPVRVRMGIHTGEPIRHRDAYVGIDVHRGARVVAAGHGGQVLLSQPTRDLLANDLGEGLALRDLGEHRLKDLTHPQRLYQLVIPGLENEFPALITLENRPTNLPTQPTPLIGREQELAQVTELVRGDANRLVTLTGAGGTGKTRLALQVAADVLEEFAGGVFFVNLAAITDPALVVATIAQALAVRERPGESLEQTLSEHLRERPPLLVLDNFEHLLAGAPALAALLDAASRLKLLVTSRAPLRLASEHEFAVPPLELPVSVDPVDVATLSQYDAVALFLERARAVRVDFQITEENAPAVAEICVRLDGLPLAIELASARVRALSPQALLRRLDQRLPLLTGGLSDAPARQQTLRGTIDWSYDLLSEPQQRFLCLLSVFMGGWDLESAEAVCDGGDALEGISTLIENSLVLEQDDPEGEPRYLMLETIREYAAGKLDAGGNADEVRRRHAEHFFALAKRAERTMTGAEITLDAPEQRVQGELPNLRAALQWALDERDLEFALRLAGAAIWAWLLSGTFSEGRAWLTRVLDETQHLQTLARARALYMLAQIATAQGDYRQAEIFNEQALDLFRRHGDQMGELQSRTRAAVLAAHLGEHDRARALLDEAQRLGEMLAEDRQRAEVYVSGAAVASFGGDYDEAQALTEQALELYRRLGVPRRLWFFQLINVGWFALLQQDFARAKSALEEYLADDSWKSSIGVANAHSNLGVVAMYERDYKAAGAHFRQALAVAGDRGVKAIIGEALYGLAAVAAVEGNADRSMCLWGAADAVKQSTESPPTEPEQFFVETYLEPARAKLGDVAGEVYTRGGSLAIDDAIAYALD